jgi:DNA processing protein
MPDTEVLLSLAGSSGALPWVTATRLASGASPAELLRPDSPEPGDLAARLERLGIRFLHAGSPEWPFAEAPPDPPCAWLFAAGRPLPPSGRSVAIVGGRRASPLRQAVAGTLAAALASAGCPIVSGGALGVDAAAHRATVDAGGHTVAVLGNGLDVPYPRANVELFQRVRAGGGTVVGEHPPGALPRPSHFLPRNRLIAALAIAVVVVEARERSGSLVTARAAGARGAGRVLAIPGAPWDPGTAGCNALIRDGAVLVRGAADVLTELGISPITAPTAKATRTPPAGLSADASRILAALAEGGAVRASQLATLTDLGAGAVGAAILELEMAGFVERSIGGVRAVRMPEDGYAAW